jgi:hypothetical protein
MRDAYKISLATLKKRPLGRTRRRWEDNIGTDRRKIVWEVVDSIHLAKDRDQWRDLLSDH